MTNPAEKYLSVKEVSAILGCGVDHIRRLIAAGRLAAVKISVNQKRGRRSYVCYRISSDELDRFIRRNAA
jgi:excisionase family DNA binding protein